MASFQGLGECALFVPGLVCCINPQRFSDHLNQVLTFPFFGRFAGGAVLQSVCRGECWAGGGEWQVVS